MYNKQTVGRINSKFRKMMHAIHNQETFADLEKCFKDKRNGPINVLIHLTKTQYKRVVSNCIHVTQKYTKDKKTYYSNIVYGNNVIKRKRKKIDSHC